MNLSYVEKPDHAAQETNRPSRSGRRRGSGLRASVPLVHGHRDLQAGVRADSLPLVAVRSAHRPTLADRRPDSLRSRGRVGRARANSARRDSRILRPRACGRRGHRHRRAGSDARSSRRVVSRPSGSTSTRPHRASTTGHTTYPNWSSHTESTSRITSTHSSDRGRSGRTGR